jgi:SAM-dependent methyltransferase
MSDKLWIEKGKTYLENFNKKSVTQKLRYLIQEQVIIGALNFVQRQSKIQFRGVLDAGCGFGRITRLLCDVFPYSRIYGIDISDDQLSAARKILPRVAFWNRSVTTSRVRVLNELTVAVELLMHIEPENIEKAIKYLAEGQPYFIITVDWWTDDREEISAGKAAGFCYLHRYGKLFSDAGYFTLKRKKIPFVKQKLRIFRRRDE